MARYRLISFKICPYVQRVAIALNAKGVDYEIEYIDLKHKPDWFLKLSPLAKVPVMVLENETVLFDSQVIAEFLDEVEAPQLHPEDAVRRAQHRAYIEVISATIPAAMRWKNTPDPAEAHKLAGDVRERLRQVCQMHKPGDFFEGDSFSLVDAAMAPLLMRCAWIEDIKPAGIFEGLSIEHWNAALLARDEVSNSAVPELERLFKATIKPLQTQAS